MTEEIKERIDNIPKVKDVRATPTISPQLIATTERFENRLQNLRNNDLAARYFKPNAIDLFRLNNHISINGEDTFDGISGYERIENDSSYRSRQVSWIVKAIQSNPNKKVRHLTILPENYPDYNRLRDGFIVIQTRAGLPDRFVFVEKSEQARIIKTYIQNMSERDRAIPVIDMAMEELSEFGDLVKWSLKNTKETILIYRDWLTETLKFDFLLNQLSEEDRNKIHIARMPISINNYEREDLIATVLICMGIKSVSFVETEPNPAMFKYIANKPRKTQQQLLDRGTWVDERIMDYVYEHPDRCNCLGGNSIINLGTKECITHHDMEILSKTYINAVTNPQEKIRILQLNSLQPIIRKLRIEM